MSTQHLVLIKCVSRLFGCMSLAWFNSQGIWIAAPSAKLSRATLLALLTDLVCYVFVGLRLGCGCWVGVGNYDCRNLAY